MADDWQIDRAKELIGWPYPDMEPIRLALTAGDTESADREGNRRLAQIGDRLIPFIITLMCYQSGVSRRDESSTQAMIQNKQECARRAKMCQLDTLVKVSVRQGNDGPSPTVLKNSMFALVAAVWMQAQDWSPTITAMTRLGLLCRRSDSISPHELMTPPSSNEYLSDAVADYRPHTGPSTEPRDNLVGVADSCISYNNTRGSGDAALHTGPSDFLGSAMTPLTRTILSSEAGSSGWSPIEVDSISPQDAECSRWSGSMCVDDAIEKHLWTPFDMQDSLENATAASLGTCLQPDASSIGNPPKLLLPRSLPDSVGHPSESPVDDSAVPNQDLERVLHRAMPELSLESRATLISITNCIGSPSALISLKILVENLREATNFEGRGKANATKIGAPRSTKDRVAAIDDLGVSLGHFALAQRMHIYMLYKEAAHDNTEPLDPRDPFVMERGTPATRTRGNPDNRRKASIGRNMAPSGQRPARFKRWRRMGERLDLLVSSFGLGILAILDEDLGVDALLKVTNQTFSNFVRTIKSVEGFRIQHMCNRARAIADTLFGYEINPDREFQIEHCDENIFKYQERCSSSLAAMLLPRV